MKKAILPCAVLLAALVVAGCEKEAENYERGTQKAMQVEAEINLKALNIAQTGYHAVNRKYGNTFDEIGFDVTGEDQRYTYFMGDDVLEGSRYMGGLPEWLPPPVVGTNNYICYAVSNLDSDDDLDIWRVDNSGRVRQLRNDMGDRSSQQ